MRFVLEDMYLKKIDRDIKGVIKVGQSDNENIKQELEEYVVTNELKRHIDDFFESYKKGIYSPTDDIGVWIQGFFGSGKSHLLKILSYLLENKVIDNKKAIEYFEDKELDNFTIANIKQAGDVSTDVVLFNIDSKSDSDSKTNKDAIVNVFNKVFNEMQGFCGSMPWIADMEKQMVKDKTYEDFKNTFKEISGETWEYAREDFYYEEDSIVEALSRSTKMSIDAARNWFNKCEDNYSLSIDRFASRVKEYINSKGKNHHIVFLVDEIGQYIGDNTQLMLNLQTVVEDLGTKCEGKCWVIVTSQEAIDEFTKDIKGNDFSKIQGRFKTRLSLSSANVDEVIKKRILRKTDGAVSHLKALYERKESIIKNILSFTNDTAEMKLYKNSDDFAEIYPFVPYQFNLLQAAFNGVREHGASGKSLSRGERSLLGAYQEVAVEYRKKETGVLIPFSAFYSTIETFLDSSIRTVIEHAKNNERLNNYDVEVLKLLFLIKYVNEVKSNLENIATLMVSNIDDDKLEIKKKVQNSLNKLIRETLVQKDGDLYTFLTNDEQDINKEIKNMQIDNGEIIQKIGEIIFEDIYKESKYSYSKQYNFAFNKMVDDRTRGPQNNKVGIRVITANYDLIGGSSVSELKLLSSREVNVIVDISKEVNYLEEIESVLKIDAYLRLKGGTRGNASIEDIKSKKGREREERYKRARFLIIEALKTADIYVSGSLLDIKEKDGVSRINEGMKNLINSQYSKINYVKEFRDSTKDLYDIVNVKMNQLSLIDKESNKLALDEVNNHISLSSSRSLQVTVKSILTKFSDIPYGWKEIDIAGILVTLFKRQEIKVIVNGEIVPPNSSEIVNYVTKKDYVERVIVKLREKVSQKYIDAVKDLNKDIFGFSSLPSDEDGLMNSFKDQCRNELDKIKDMLRNYNFKSHYPGEDILKEGKRVFEEIIDVKDTVEFYKKVYDLEDELLDYEEAIDDIKSFFFKKENGRIDFDSKGEQRSIFDNAVNTLNNYEENKEFIVNNEVNNIVNEIKQIIKMKEPYKKIPSIPLLVEKYNNKILELLEEESKPVKKDIEACKDEVLRSADEYNLIEEFSEKINEQFESIMKRVESANNFIILSAMSDLAEKSKVKLINEIENKYRISMPTEKTVITEEEQDPKTAEISPVLKTKTISFKELVKWQRVIKSKEDIDEIVEDLRKKLQEQLENNTIINLV